MGMQLEFNWYLVLKSDPQIVTQELEHPTFLADKEVFYRTHKTDARIYPVGGVVPIIQNDVAIGLAYIRECSHRLGAKNQVFTVIDYHTVLTFDENDPVALHYTDMYTAYKKKQQVEDHGGKFKSDDFVNAMTRRGFEEALTKIGD